jgi:hypothetical protein
MRPETTLGGFDHMEVDLAQGDTLFMRLAISAIPRQIFFVTSFSPILPSRNLSINN